MAEDKVVMAVDVGTGSAWAGVFDAIGRTLGRGVRPILMNRPAPDHAEPDSSDIWRAVCAACRKAPPRWNSHLLLQVPCAR